MFFDRPDAGERALLVHCEFTSWSRPSRDAAKSQAEQSGAEVSLGRFSACPDEFFDLAQSAGVEPLVRVSARRKLPTPNLFIGKGKVEELKQLVAEQKIDVVLFNHSLSPSQERNLEQELCCRVLDRTGLILDIFAQRARSHAGKLQVELAQLEHISTRLVRGWTHLERQKGGIGMRGPGESQLETDRRLLRERIKWITQRLNRVNAQRQQGRRARKKAELPTVALVGYTNAGKSTLFNQLTAGRVYTADQLFATLDPTLRALDIPHFGQIILADTVGFVRHLPHQLVAAFRATLEEAAEADLLIHVVDVSAEDIGANISAVKTVLKEIGAGEIPVLEVMNKVDCVPEIQPGIERTSDGQPRKVFLSAKMNQGMDSLTTALAELLGGRRWQGEIKLRLDQSKLRAQLYEAGAVVAESYSDVGDCCLQLSYPESELQRILVAADQSLPIQ